MQNVSEMTLVFMNDRLPEELKRKFIEAFTLFDVFQVVDYETELDNIIALDGRIESEDLKDMFVLKVVDYADSIISEHGILFNEEAEISINEKIELLHFLHLMQIMEDRALISYMLSSDDANKNILVNLISKFTYLEEFRVMEMIKEVSPRLITALRNLNSDLESQQPSIEHLHLQEWNIFKDFIGTENPCLGFELEEKGYMPTTLSTLLGLELDNIQKRFKSIETNTAQIALDVMSLLYLCSDTYQIPMMEYDKHASDLLLSTEQVTKVKHVMTSMISDRELHKVIYLKERQVNEGKNHG